MSRAKYKDCYVAFLDILGFKELLKKDDFDQIYSIFKAIKEFKPSPVVELPIYSEIKFYIMSDSIIVYVDASKKDSFISLTDVCAQIQMYLLRQETPIIVRGGIARGTLYCKNNIIFGTGLSNAYLLEEGLAVYPRIIFTESTLKQALENAEFTKIWDFTGMFYKKDDDDLFYIDYLNPHKYIMQAPIKAVEDTEQWIIEYFENVVRFINHHLASELNSSVRNKYIWLKKKMGDEIDNNDFVKTHFKQKEIEEHERYKNILRKMWKGNAGNENE